MLNENTARHLLQPAALITVLGFGMPQLTRGSPFPPWEPPQWIIAVLYAAGCLGLTMLIGSIWALAPGWFRHASRRAKLGVAALAMGLCLVMVLAAPAISAYLTSPAKTKSDVQNDKRLRT